jgi:hypothetical protein
MAEASFIDLLSRTDPLGIATQVLILLYLAYETRRGKIKKLENMVMTMITVVRAIARTTDDIDESKVDAYLLENGVSPDHFIAGDNLQNDDEEDSEKDFQKVVQESTD